MMSTYHLLLHNRDGKCQAVVLDAPSANDAEQEVVESFPKLKVVDIFRERNVGDENKQMKEPSDER